MGAKQSKRSVDISGKEAEGAGEVAAAGAGGEGRMEPLADVDALKPQANGEAHITEPITEKEKELDVGTPENEKDATTEKEIKEQENDKEKEAAPLTNGDGEPKQENGDSSPAPEEGKKPKKEKVKKKWSLRSISFSRKDKPKQDKKQKDEEPKVNGDSEIVAEEAGVVATPETVNESPEEAKSQTSESKDDKTPETPVTEPLTNGSSTPETPKVESSPVLEEPALPANPAPVASEPEKSETKVEPEPEKLPINGLSLEETSEPPSKIEESKPSEFALESKETILAPEIPVKIEVCVDQKPVDSPPPPLPANPPPSNAASFAASTMAPDLDASLLTTASTLPTIVNASGDNLPNQAVKQIIESAPPSKVPENIEVIELNPKSADCKLGSSEITEQNISDIVTIKKQKVILDCEQDIQKETIHDVVIPDPIAVENTVVETVLNNIPIVPTEIEKEVEVIPAVENETPQLIETVKVENIHEVDISEQTSETHELHGDVAVQDKIDEPISETSLKSSEAELTVAPVIEVSAMEADINLPPVLMDDALVQDIAPISEVSQMSTAESIDSQDSSEDLPPPPPPLDDSDLVNETVVSIHCATENNENIEAKQIDHITTKEVNNTNCVEHGITNGNSNITEQENIKNKSKDLVDKNSGVKCNGDTESELSSPESHAAADLQESLPVCDKIADLIPEVPAVPDLNTETDTTIEVDN